MPDFSHLDAFDLKQYEDDACFDYGNGEGIRLSSSIEKEAGFHLLESPLSANQQGELEDAYEITATVVVSAYWSGGCAVFWMRRRMLRNLPPPFN